MSSPKPVLCWIHKDPSAKWLGYFHTGARPMSVGGSVVNLRRNRLLQRTLSASFPYGERFFMDSVRRYRDCTTGALKDQIGAFLSQVATHAREHLLFNSQVAEHNLGLAAMEARSGGTARVCADARAVGAIWAKPSPSNISTAILAHHALLSDPRHPAGSLLMGFWQCGAGMPSKRSSTRQSLTIPTLFANPFALRHARRWALRVSTMVVATWLLFALP